jgi:hypothetical protein
MDAKEFQELHGVRLWHEEVAPRQTDVAPMHVRCNANILVHSDMVLPWIRMMTKEGFIDEGSAGVSLLRARERFLKLHPGVGNENLWRAVLAYCRQAAPKLSSETEPWTRSYSQFGDIDV